MKSKLLIGYLFMLITLVLGWLGGMGNYGSLGINNELAIFFIYAGIPFITVCFFFYLFKNKLTVSLKILNIVLVIIAILITISNGIAILIGIASAH